MTIKIQLMKCCVQGERMLARCLRARLLGASKYWGVQEVKRVCEMFSLD